MRYGLIIHRDTNVVADVIQELFVWLLQNPSSVKNIKNLELYLFKSLKRNLLRYRADHAHLTNFPLHENPEYLDFTIEDRIIQQETKGQQRKLLYKELNNLPPKQKEVIYLRYYESLTYEEIADILSTNNQVVRNYVSRALTQLRKSLDSY
ncbi:MAG: DNA-directed RNA polymerase sigma-70 factor [Cyclobacteriaceae bacterium]|nr:MAG: DNA-directed RNA polymerase sigma-70 factor [Cyclobacteriaceae bacterium]